MSPDGGNFGHESLYGSEMHTCEILGSQFFSVWSNSDLKFGQI